MEAFSNLRTWQAYQWLTACPDMHRQARSCRNDRELVALLSRPGSPFPFLFIQMGPMATVQYGEILEYLWNQKGD